MIDFLKYRWLMAVYSLCIMGSFVGVYIYKQRTRGEAFTYGVDFTGGTQALLKFNKPVSSQQIKEILEKEGWANPVTRDFSSQEILIRLKEFSNDVKGLGEKIQLALQKSIPETEVSILQVEGVGAGVGAELRWKSMRAVLIALLAMLLYIAFTFWSFAFAMGAVIALFHDSIIIFE